MIALRHVLIAAACLIAADAALAQNSSVSGRVFDARTRQPLARVLVAVENQPLFTETNPDGTFTVTTPPGPQVLTISLIGYALVRRPIEVAGPLSGLEIALAEGAGPFEEQVTVSAKASAPADAAPAGATLYGRELQALRGVTLDDPMRALQALPAATSTDDFYGEFTVRGLGFRHVGLAVDGFPTRYLMHSVHGVSDGGSIAMINSDAVASVSLMPGGYPQKLGRHLGAQIDLSLREGDRSGFRARAGLSGTSAAVVAEGPFAGTRGSWLVSGRRSYLDLLLNRIEDDNSLAFGFSDAQVKIVFDATTTNQLTALTSVGASKFTEDPEQLGTNDEAEVAGQTWLSGLGWRYAPSPRFSIAQRVYATGLRFDNTNNSGDILDRNRNADYGWRADALADAGIGVFEFGADYERLSGRHDVFRALNDATNLSPISAYDALRQRSSVYAQAVVRVGSRFTVTPGMRLDAWGDSSTSTSPWITADLAATSSTRVRVGGGVYRQVADLEQTFGTRGGGEELRPERAAQFDVGMVQSLPSASSIGITWFNRDERDVLFTPDAEPRRLPDGTIQLGRGDAPWVNDLTGRARGFEVVLKRDAPSGIAGWAAYAHNAHQYTSATTGESFASDAEQRHAVSLFGYYRLSNRSTVGLKFRYGSNYPRVGYFEQAAPPPGQLPLFGGANPLFITLSDQRNALRLPAYARLDARFDRAFTWQRRRRTLFVEVANVLNRTNLRNVPYDVGRTGRVLGGTDSMMPVLPSAGFVIEF